MAKNGEITATVRICGHESPGVVQLDRECDTAFRVVVGSSRTTCDIRSRDEHDCQKTIVS
jgi:hypothetical protein